MSESFSPESFPSEQMLSEFSPVGVMDSEFQGRILFSLPPKKRDKTSFLSPCVLEKQRKHILSDSLLLPHPANVPVILSSSAEKRGVFCAFESVCDLTLFLPVCFPLTTGVCLSLSCIQRRHGSRGEVLKGCACKIALSLTADSAAGEKGGMMSLSVGRIPVPRESEIDLPVVGGARDTRASSVSPAVERESWHKRF